MTHRSSSAAPSLRRQHPHPQPARTLPSTLPSTLLPTPSTLLHRRHAFSLIELLVSIAVVAILATLLVPLVSSTRSNATLIRDAERLRQIGMAIHLYAQDNDHQLPGPLYTNQVCYYNQSWLYHLATHLAIYLGGTEPDGETRLLTAMVSPEYFDLLGGLNRVAPGNATPYHIVQRGAMPSGSGIFPNSWTLASPFGYPPSGSKVAREPMNIRDIDYAPLANIPAITNTNINGEQTSFGLVRNTLYLDGHVRRIHKGDPIYENY